MAGADAAPESGTGSSLAVEVVAAVIRRADGAILFAQRPEGKVYAGWWEFPGGKVEEGESRGEALARELHEELGIQVLTSRPWLTREYVYPHATVRLHFRIVTGWQGEPQSREGQALAWQHLEAPLVEPMLPANEPILASLRLPVEYAISAAAALGEAAFLARLEERLSAGLRLLQLREKSMDPAALGRMAAQVMPLARAHGARVLLNGEPGLARDLGVDGVHLTSERLMRTQARPPGLMVAASCHDAGQLAHAGRLGLDFAVLGPVCPTPSHPGEPGMGWSAFETLLKDNLLPVYAIGGMSGASLEQAWQCGAHGVAMISAAWAQA